jgi:hypothetical protein
MGFYSKTCQVKQKWLKKNGNIEIAYIGSCAKFVLQDFYMNDKEKIKNMKEGDTVFLNMFQDGGAQVHKYNYEYLLYEIPLYGGKPQFSGVFKNIDRLIETYKKWT